MGQRPRLAARFGGTGVLSTAPRLAAGIAGAALLAACTDVPRDRGVSEVQSLVAARTGARVEWRRGGPEDEQAEALVNDLLSRPLTADSAAQVAVLNNRSLQATFEDLGIAQADLVQAGLLSNPTFGVSARFPDKPPSGTDLEVFVVQPLLEAFSIPARQRMAETELEKAQIAIAREATTLVARTRGALFEAQAQTQRTRVLELYARAAAADAALAARQHLAGTINDLEAAQRQAEAMGAAAEADEARAGISAARERVSRLLGHRPGQPDWSTAAELPALPAEEPDERDLESAAVARRLDLAAARRDVRVIEQASEIARTGVFTRMEIGLDSERDPSGVTVTGPNLAIEVPVFDHGQGSLRRLEAQLRQAKARADALEVEARSEVREAAAEMRSARRRAELLGKGVVLLRERIVSLAQEQYDAMAIGPADLLKARQADLRARADAVSAVEAYWKARTKLEQASGGVVGLTSRAAESPAPPAEPPRPAQPETKHGHGDHS